MSLICERCGKEFDGYGAREEFEDETGKNFDYLIKTLCGKCAVQAINDKEDGVQYALTIEKAFNSIANGDIERCRRIIRADYPFIPVVPDKRSYTISEKMKVFVRDGFTDRYTEDKLINPGVLKILSIFCPNEFPYHPHGKMTEGHVAYWELFPTVDHLIPIARGGKDSVENRVTTSMLHNQVKNNWTLEQLNWELHDPSDFKDWDGLTIKFIEFVSQNPDLLNDNYISSWYRASKDALKQESI